jgi:hypothetical protein
MHSVRRRARILCFWLSCGLSSAPGASAQPASEIQLPELRKELLERRERDQVIRNAVIQSGAENPDPKLAGEMRRIDRENTARMQEIVRQHGWPGPELVGRDGTEAAWLLVQHSTPEFQREMLPLVEKAYREKKLRGSNYALLLDRVRVHQGKPQVYGSQGRWENGVLNLQPIEDPENVDQRRAEVGLGPLDEYLARLRSSQGSKAPTTNPSPGGQTNVRARAPLPNGDFARLVELEKRSAAAILAFEAATDEKERSSLRTGISSLQQQLSWARSVAGDYAGSLVAFRRANEIGVTRPKPPIDSAEKARELTVGFNPRDALASIVDAARDRQIVILNEAHHLSRHRAFALLLARELRSIGFDYLACEGFSSNLDALALKARQYPKTSDGFYIREPLFADLVRQSLALGYMPVAYEHQGSSSAGRSPTDSMNEREAGQANNLVTRIFRDNPRARVFIYVGFAHLKKTVQNRSSEPGRTVEWMASRLKTATGIDPLTIDQVTMTDPEDASIHGTLLRQVFAGRSASESSLVLRHAMEARHLVLGTYAGDADVQVFHRPTEFVNGRPDWLTMNGYRKPRTIPPDLLPKTGRRLVQAFLEGETAGAIAVDQVMVDADALNDPVFMLPEGRYRFAFEEN